MQQTITGRVAYMYDLWVIVNIHHFSHFSFTDWHFFCVQVDIFNPLCKSAGGRTLTNIAWHSIDFHGMKPKFYVGLFAPHSPAQENLHAIEAVKVLHDCILYAIR